ncbi:hypothetical protein A2121_00965 [Candidatus Nomurabacteria bacterium GWB1_40_6]|uniref:Uncharacterized protein n=1 Tax=Candidatus Nomurabacteria bacterium GWB1_40_6 TaxID=1801727 RepID=A0A1F6TL19_9BACT|nr:MAG: hypothetical protein A2121_00965 [Candidatus Nomurabacteria bacterium GWB1_40_6]
MKRIINIKTKEEVKFTKENLPLFVHGKEHSGASLLSITIASLLHSSRVKLCIFTAYPMAKEEFMKQVENPVNVYYLEDKKNISEALRFQTIIVQSGNIDLFIKIILNTVGMKDRIIFIKNIETIHVQILELVKSYTFMVSGDLDFNLLQNEFKNMTYNTKIFTSPMEGVIIPPLEKYQAFMKDNIGDRIIAVN